MNRIWKFSLMISVLVILDQVTKGVVQSKFYVGETLPIIDGFFNLTYVRNPGAAFGFLAGAHKNIREVLFLYIPVLACFWLIWLIWTERHKSLILGLSYSLILAGAMGNLIDRFSMRYVVDFLDFYWRGNHFPAFNVADSAITVGGVLLAIDFLLLHAKKSSTQQQPES